VITFTSFDMPAAKRKRTFSLENLTSSAPPPSSHSHGKNSRKTKADLLAGLPAATANNDTAIDTGLFDATFLHSEVKRLNNLVEKLKTQVEFLLSLNGIDNIDLNTLPPHSAAKSSEAGNDHGQPASGVNSYAAKVSTTKPNKLQGQLRDAVLATVHTDLLQKDQRRRNITVTGLVADNNHADKTLFLDICERDLQCVPTVLHSRRVGSANNSRPALLIVTLSSETEARQVLARAKNLRKSSLQAVSKCVFFNPDLTKAESKAAYDLRCQRRLTRLNRAGKSI
jgi:hypothetical protein